MPSLKIFLAAKCQIPCWGEDKTANPNSVRPSNVHYHFSVAVAAYDILSQLLSLNVQTNVTCQSNTVILQHQQMYLYSWLEQSIKCRFISISLKLTANGSLHLKQFTFLTYRVNYS